MASSNPLTVVLEDDGQVLTRVFGDDGTPGPRVRLAGPAGRYAWGDRRTTVLRGHVLVGPHDSGVVAATDLRTGRLL